MDTEAILALRHHLSLKDFIDIFIVSWLFFFILQMIKGTRGMQVMLGLIALLGLWGVASFYQLFALHWILKHFFEFSFIVFLILFQDEIKKTLAHIGQTPAAFKRSENEIVSHLLEISEAAFILAQQKLGALMVFERATPLRNYFERGVLLQSEISTPLIVALFQTNSPLHDGAVCFSQGKLSYAGVFLPLKEQQNSLAENRQWGTRHRAALDLSNETDALIVVVSEETQEVRICERGAFSAPLTAALLPKLLKRSLVGLGGKRARLLFKRKESLKS